MNIRKANWPAPEHVIACSTTRHHGFSQPPYDSNNLALHVGDNEGDVEKNRNLLNKELHLTEEPIWLEQTHSTTCINADNESQRLADASTSRTVMRPLAILTADCLPITLCDERGLEIAAIHAGWRGLFNGIIENTLKKMFNKPEHLMAWIGPAICQKCYEVGHEVHHAFTNKYPKTQAAFEAVNSKWLANLPFIAEIVLNQLGIHAVYQSGLCTFESKNDFFSYRRTQETGRMATFIWLKSRD